MQTPEEDTHFHEKTDTFELTATLKESKITISLKDFTDWTIYSKEYTPDDIGKEINHKMNLYDIYTAFSQTKPHQAH